MAMSFAEIRRAVPSIHVFKPFDERGARDLTAENTDESYENRLYSDGHITGDGSEKTPYTYRSATSVSPHYAIIDLWFEFRDRISTVFIEVNDWVLQVGHDGVTAADGHFTKLT